MKGGQIVDFKQLSKGNRKYVLKEAKKNGGFTKAMRVALGKDKFVLILDSENNPIEAQFP